jgi:hypothetical protein
MFFGLLEPKLPARGLRNPPLPSESRSSISPRSGNPPNLPLPLPLLKISSSSAKGPPLPLPPASFGPAVTVIVSLGGEEACGRIVVDGLAAEVLVETVVAGLTVTVAGLAAGAAAGLFDTKISYEGAIGWRWLPRTVLYELVIWIERKQTRKE